MLVLMLGPSGVGKSTIIEVLVARYEWKPLTSYVTRPARIGETRKLCVSEEDYAAMQARGEFWSDIPQNGAHYGLLASEIDLALRDTTDFHIVDYGLKSRELFFGAHEHFAVYLAAGKNDILETRLGVEGRLDRLRAAIATSEELEGWWAKPEASKDSLRIVNLQDAQLSVASNIDQGARAWLAAKASKC